jgi:hypothetical protein
VALLAVTLLTKSCHDEQTQTVGVHESRWFGKVVADVWGKKSEYYVCHPQGGQEGGDLPRVQSEIAQDERGEDGEVELRENRQSHAHHDVDENGVLEQVQVEGFCHALVKSRQVLSSTSSSFGLSNKSTCSSGGGTVSSTFMCHLTGCRRVAAMKT